MARAGLVGWSVVVTSDVHYHETWTGWSDTPGRRGGEGRGGEAFEAFENCSTPKPKALTLITNKLIIIIIPVYYYNQ